MIGRRIHVALFALVLGSLALVGCDRQYVYAPAVGTTSFVSGRPATYARIPPEAPRGDVRVATVGIAGLRPRDSKDDDDDEVRAVHIRMIVANNSERPWTVDTREQRLVLPGNGESRPAYAAANQGAAPVIDVPAGEKREIDLFYPLPEHLEKASKLPSFDLVWRVQTDSRLVAERTPFERLTVEPRRDYYYYGGYGHYGWGYGWGPPYYDPWYPRGAFIGARMGGPIYGGGAGGPMIRQRGYVQQAPPAR